MNTSPGHITYGICHRTCRTFAPGNVLRKLYLDICVEKRNMDPGECPFPRGDQYHHGCVVTRYRRISIIICDLYKPHHDTPKINSTVSGLCRILGVPMQNIQAAHQDLPRLDGRFTEAVTYAVTAADPHELHLVAERLRHQIQVPEGETARTVLDRYTQIPGVLPIRNVLDDDGN